MRISRKSFNHSQHTEQECRLRLNCFATLNLANGSPGLGFDQNRKESEAWIEKSGTTTLQAAMIKHLLYNKMAPNKNPLHRTN